MWELYSDRAPSPELELIEREEAERIDVEDYAPLLAKMPQREGEYLTLWLSGKTQQDIADVYGVSQDTVSHRIRRLIQRVRWVAGPGSWFTGHELQAFMFRACMTLESGELMARYWDTTSIVACVTGVGMTRNDRVARYAIDTMHDRIWALAWNGSEEATTYALGLDELASWGRELLRARR